MSKAGGGEKGSFGAPGWGKNGCWGKDGSWGKDGGWGKDNSWGKDAGWGKGGCCPKGKGPVFNTGGFPAGKPGSQQEGGSLGSRAQVRPPNPYASKVNPYANAKHGKKLFIGGISQQTDVGAMKAYFLKFGDISDCVVMKDGAGRNRGFGFVQFTKKEAAVRCMQAYGTHFFDGRYVEVKPCDRDEQKAQAKEEAEKSQSPPPRSRSRSTPSCMRNRRKKSSSGSKSKSSSRSRSGSRSGGRKRSVSKSRSRRRSKSGSKGRSKSRSKSCSRSKSKSRSCGRKKIRRKKGSSSGSSAKRKSSGKAAEKKSIAVRRKSPSGSGSDMQCSESGSEAKRQGAAKAALSAAPAAAAAAKKRSPSGSGSDMRCSSSEKSSRSKGRASKGAEAKKEKASSKVLEAAKTSEQRKEKKSSKDAPDRKEKKSGKDDKEEKEKKSSKAAEDRRKESTSKAGDAVIDVDRDRGEKLKTPSADVIDIDEEEEDEVDLLDVRADQRRALASALVNNESLPVKRTPEGLPEPISSWQDAVARKYMSADIMQKLQAAGLERPTLIQRHALPIIAHEFGKYDLIASAQTGSGKTFAFVIPTVSRLMLQGAIPRPFFPGPMAQGSPLVLMLSPTRELAIQTSKEIQVLTKGTSFVSQVVYGGESLKLQVQKIAEAQTDILCATPGRLIDMIDQGKVSLSFVQCAVLDEADQMLELGMEMAEILTGRDMPNCESGRQTLLFSATMPQKIRDLLPRMLRKDSIANVLIGNYGDDQGGSCKRITQILKWVPEEHFRMQALAADLHTYWGRKGKVVIFTNQRSQAGTLSSSLTRQGISCAHLHGKLEQQVREEVVDRFRRGLAEVLVATNVASRGLDFPDISLVVQFNLPQDVDVYTHRIGRTGRGGQVGCALSYMGPKDLHLCDKLVDFMDLNNQEIPQWLLDRSSYKGKLPPKRSTAKAGRKRARSRSSSSSSSKSSSSSRRSRRKRSRSRQRRSRSRSRKRSRSRSRRRDFQLGKGGAGDLRSSNRDAGFGNRQGASGASRAPPVDASRAASWGGSSASWPSMDGASKGKGKDDGFAGAKGCWGGKGCDDWGSGWYGKGGPAVGAWGGYGGKGCKGDDSWAGGWGPGCGKGDVAKGCKGNGAWDGGWGAGYGKGCAMSEGAWSGYAKGAPKGDGGWGPGYGAAGKGDAVTAWRPSWDHIKTSGKGQQGKAGWS